jgi:flavin-dependent dehydrogenase
VALLGQWGLLEPLLKAGSRPIDHESYEAPGVRLEGFSEPVDGYRTTYAPRRFVLDPILAAGAVAAGADFRDGCTVTDVLVEGDRVVGVRYTTPGGIEATDRARLVVGADGMRSLLARRVAAPNVVEHPRMTCVYYSYWSGVPTHFELYERPGRMIALAPTNDDLTLVMTYFPQSEYDAIRSAAESAYLDAVRTTAPGLYERMAAGRRVERMYGTGHQDNYFRKAQGPGWVLVGDAVHHKDSITARGITDAFLQARLLTECVGGGLHGDVALTAALTRYENGLNDTFGALYQGVLNVGELKPSGRAEMLRHLAGHQQLIDRYFSTVSGACSLDDFYNDELLAVLDQQN